MELRAKVTRWVDDYQPGFVEVQFEAADGSTVSLVDKIPVFGADVEPGTTYPVPITVDCAVVAEHGDQVEIELLHGVMDGDQRSRFTVRRESLIA